MPMNGKRLALLSLDPNLTGEAWQDAVKHAREQGVSNLDFLRGRLDPPCSRGTAQLCLDLLGARRRLNRRRQAEFSDRTGSPVRASVAVKRE